MCQQLRNNLFFSGRKLGWTSEHTGSYFDDSAPGEEDLINYFKFIRTKRQMASMWDNIVI